MKNLLQHNQEKIQQIRKLLLEGRRKGYSRYTSYCWKVGGGYNRYTSYCRKVGEGYSRHTSYYWKVGEGDIVDTQAIVGR